MISAAVLGQIDPRLLDSAVRCFLRHTSGGRMAPGILTAFPRYAAEHHMLGCYAPIATWSVTKAWRQDGDRRPGLSGLYPLLKALHERW